MKDCTPKSGDIQSEHIKRHGGDDDDDGDDSKSSRGEVVDDKRRLLHTAVYYFGFFVFVSMLFMSRRKVYLYRLCEYVISVK